MYIGLASVVERETELMSQADNFCQKSTCQRQIQKNLRLAAVLMLVGIRRECFSFSILIGKLIIFRNDSIDLGMGTFPKVNRISLSVLTPI